ncbi:MAG: porin, partial [Pseudorhodoplanes sp.]
MKVCSLYGAGFYYIPGTDTCLMIGGFVRSEWMHNAGGSFTTYGLAAGMNANAQFNRATDTLVNRTRGLFSFDIRSQTEYGTLRSYVRAGWQWTTNTDSIGGSATTVYLDRAFIQFAGFTFGKTQSFFDVPDIADMTYQTEEARNNTGGSGTPVFAYTAMLGNGVTATLSLEDYSERRTAVVDLSTAALRAAAFSIGAANASDNHGNEVPDIVGNLRVDQAWGSAQVSGALHLNQAQYYGAPALNSGQQGHPDDKWGWAVGAGILLKMPWDAKDTFAVAGSYAEGATTYVWNVGGAFGARGGGANITQVGGVAGGWLDDAYFGPLGQLELPTAWNVQAGFQHYWTNSLRSSIWGSYSVYEANSSTIDTLVCPARGQGPGCADFNAYQIGSRTIWNPVTNLDIGLEVMYTKVETAFAGGIAGPAALGGTVP